MSASSVVEESGHSKESLRLWLRLLACESMLEQYVRSNLRNEFGITLPQFDVLAELDYMKKPLTMTELSRQLMVSNGNITGVVDRLHRDAYVERLPSTKDRRVQLISLSEKGRNEFENMARQHENWIASAFEDMDVSDIKRITKLLNKTADKLKTKFGKSRR